MGDGMTKIHLLAIQEDKNEIIIETLQPARGPQLLVDGMWFYSKRKLPDGIHMIMIVGERGSKGSGGAALDDIEVKECRLFHGEFITALFAAKFYSCQGNVYFLLYILFFSKFHVHVRMSFQNLVFLQDLVLAILVETLKPNQAKHV